MRTVAALFVEARGPYAGLEGVDVWPESRDARLYDGPHPVVAHPPCSRWCQLAYVVQARYGHRVGDDGGCFWSALQSVRRFGGVLEHPAWSIAWVSYGLTAPSREGGWSASADGGWVCHVEQGMYGHRARKATWLLVHGHGAEPHALRWGASHARATVSFMTNHGGGSLPRLSKREASATPPDFMGELLTLARGAR